MNLGSLSEHDLWRLCKHNTTLLPSSITELCDESVDVNEQTCLYDMMEGQEEGLRERFDQEVVSLYGEHVTGTNHKNEGVQLDSEVLSPSSNRHVPSDIIAVIFIVF